MSDKLEKRVKKLESLNEELTKKIELLTGQIKGLQKSMAEYQDRIKDSFGKITAIEETKKPTKARKPTITNFFPKDISEHTNDYLMWCIDNNEDKLLTIMEKDLKVSRRKDKITIKEGNVKFTGELSKDVMDEIYKEFIKGKKNDSFS